MNVKLTYLFIGATFICAGSSCSSGNEEPESGVEIRFSSPVASRTAQTTTSNMAARGSFALYGDRVFKGETDDGTLMKVFENREVKYLNDSWLYDNKEYWYPSHEHSFVAIHPYGTTTDHFYDNSRLTFTFSMPADRKTTPDLLLATHRRFYSIGTSLPVMFRFGHVLTLVNVAPAMDDNIMSSEDYVEFHKMVLTGFKTKATFSVFPALRQSATQTDDYEIDITNQTEEGSVTYDFNPPVRIMNRGGNVTLLKNDDAIILLPQNFASNSEAKIVLSYTIKGEPDMKEVTLELMNQKWLSGKSYSYKFTVSRTGIFFDMTTITDWDELNGGDFNAH